MSRAHRFGPGKPVPQGFGAVAALERDDRTAVSERVPPRLPGGRGNRPARGVQARGAGFHTSRTGGSLLPPRSGAGYTCYLKPSRAGSHVTAAPARAVQCPVVQGDGGGIDSLPRKHRAAMISLPLRTGGERASRAARGAGSGVRTGADTRRVVQTVMPDAVQRRVTRMRNGPRRARAEAPSRDRRGGCLAGCPEVRHDVVARMAREAHSERQRAGPSDGLGGKAAVRTGTFYST